MSDCGLVVCCSVGVGGFEDACCVGSIRVTPDDVSTQDLTGHYPVNHFGVIVHHHHYHLLDRGGFVLNVYHQSDMH